MIGAGLLHAQDKLWVNGNQVLDFKDATNGLKLCGLPTGQDYNGASAQYAQNAQYDENGKLLFFIVDGNIYDHAGYLMADNDATPNCTDCVMKGIQETSIVAVPGTCDKYYIITADVNFTTGITNFDERSQLAYAVLDLSLPSHFHAGRKGRLWTQQDVDAAGWNAFATGMNGAQLGANTQFLITYGSAAPDGSGSWTSFSGRTGNILHTVVDGLGGFPPLLVIKNNVKFICAPITAQGIGPVTVIDNVYTPDADNALTMAGQLTAATGPDGILRVACTTNSGPATLSAADDYTIQLFALDPTGLYGTPIAQLQTNLNLVNAQNFRTRGATFSPNGRYLYFAQSFIPYVGYVDVLDPTFAVHDLGAMLGMDFSGYGCGQISCNVAPSGTGTALYLSTATGMACILDPDNPGAGTFQIAAGTGGNVAPPPASAWAMNPATSFSFTQYLRDKQNRNDQQIPHLELAACCQDNERIPEWSHELFFNGVNSASAPWTPEDNPLTGPLTCTPNPNLPQSQLDELYGHAYFDQDYLVQAGARLYVKDMDWHFAPDAKLIIEPGAFVRFENCTLQGTLDEDCQPQRWPGIRIEGTTTASQFPLVNGSQGYVSMVNSTVSNAVTGVWCAKQNGGTADPASYGGVIRAQGSTFKNCITGVRITDYNYNNTPEASTFYNTTFVTDNDRPDQTAPYAHAYIENTRTVNFTDCRFTNLTTYPVMIGTGVMILNGQVNISGSNYQNAYFQNLMIGVSNSGGTLTPSTVNHMGFTGNQYGIFDHGTNFSRYTNNRFTIPGSGGNMYAAVGMYLWQPQGYTIERNIFTGDGNSHNVGIYFLGINTALPFSQWVYSDNQIYDNTFDGLYAGSIVKGVHRGIDPSELDGGLSLFCGDFTDNIFNIALLKASIIKPDQGHTGSQLSGNRFLTTANCTNTWDWNLDPAWNVVPGLYNGMHLNVFRNEDPVCDVQCDYWPDFADIAVLYSGPWTSETCNGGKLDQPHTIPGDLAQYQLANSQLMSALNVYNGNLDKGEKPDLIAMLVKEEPPLPSSTLRDALLANSPLSDEVLVTMLKREPAMDPWHLTQVLVANVRLNPGVVGLAKELLSPFYFGVVNDAQEGSGITWKQLMEQEIEQRRREKANALASLGYLYGTDTLIAGAVDSLRMIFASDSDLSYTQVRTAMYINDRNWSAAERELNGTGKKLNGWQAYTDLMNFGANHNGDWSKLEPNEVAALDQHAHEGGAGAAMANGILRAYGFSDYLPEVQFPREGPEPRLVQVQPSTPVARPALALYPNPANTEAYLKWPVEHKGSLIQIMDTQGRILLDHQAEENGLSRLDLTGLPAGLYKVCLSDTGLCASFSIVR